MHDLSCSNVHEFFVFFFENGTNSSLVRLVFSETVNERTDGVFSHTFGWQTPQLAVMQYWPINNKVIIHQLTRFPVSSFNFIKSHYTIIRNSLSFFTIRLLDGRFHWDLASWSTFRDRHCVHLWVVAISDSVPRL